MVRREISSTLGRKTAIWEPEEERESLLSQGESCWVLLKKKAVLAANAMAKLNPSDRCTVVSAHVEYAAFVSLDRTAASHDGDATAARASRALARRLGSGAMGWTVGLRFRSPAEVNAALASF